MNLQEEPLAKVITPKKSIMRRKGSYSVKG